MNPGDPRWCALIRAGRAERQKPGSTGADGGARPLRRREVDRTDFDPDYDPGRPIICELCGNEMRYTAVCKIECRVCGYKRDCSDP